MRDVPRLTVSDGLPDAERAALDNNAAV